MPRLLEYRKGESIMNAQEKYLEWLKQVNELDISKEQDLLALFRAVRDLNVITQQAEREVF